MPKIYKKKIVITGGTGLLGGHFYRKYKNKFSIIKYPYKIEHFKRFAKWISKKKFNYFIHFAAITKNESKQFKKILQLVNVKSPIRILDIINKKKDNHFSYFLFICSSHVYGYSKKKIKETKRRIPQNVYGKSKKRVEDYIINNRKKFNFKVGIARIFNSTGPKQKKGNFVPDMIYKMKKLKAIKNINQYRDFIHIDDVSRSIKCLIEKQVQNPINISSGKKVNLINVGRFTDQKDQITLLKAVNLLKDEINFNLLIVGYGKKKNFLLNYINENNLEKKVKIVPYQTNPYNLI